MYKIGQYARMIKPVPEYGPIQEGEIIDITFKKGEPKYWLRDLENGIFWVTEDNILIIARLKRPDIRDYYSQVIKDTP